MADFGLGSMGGMMFGWLTTIFFWLGVGVIFIGITVGFLILKRNKRLRFNVIEITDLGGGKIGCESLKGGWFRSQTMFFGLIEVGGEEIFKVKDRGIMGGSMRRRVLCASSEDYHDINGRRGLIVQRKGDDTSILLPISKFKLEEESKKMLMSIAPADFRDGSVALIEDATRETKGTWERFLPVIMFAGLGVLMLICMILLVKMVQSSQAEAWKNTMEAIKMANENKALVAQSLAPLFFAFKKKWFG